MSIGQCIIACLSSLSLFVADHHAVVGTHHVLFIHSSVDGHLGCFHFWVITNGAAVSAHRCFVWASIFLSPGCVPDSGVSGARGNPIGTLLKNCQAVFQSGTINLILTHLSEKAACA